MNYWLFEEGDVVGPFTARQLMVRGGFGPGSLVCPEDRAHDESYWKPASEYKDFTFSASASSVPDTGDLPSVAAEVFEREMMATLSGAKAALASPDEIEPAAQHAALQMPAKRPAKYGPIEDYFNNIKGKDLGDILDIPDPNENSDLNLQRALETQLEKTAPPVQDNTPDPFDEFTSTANELEDIFTVPSAESAAENHASPDINHAENASAPENTPKENTSPDLADEATAKRLQQQMQSAGLEAPAPLQSVPLSSQKPDEEAWGPVFTEEESLPDENSAAQRDSVSDARPETPQENPSENPRTEQAADAAGKEENFNGALSDIVPLGGNSLPCVPAEGVLPVARPQNPPEELNAFAAQQAEPAEEKTYSPSAEEVSQPVELVRAETKQTAITEEIRVKPRLQPTPEMEKFITARVARVRRPYGRALVWAAVAFVLALVFGAAYLKRLDLKAVSEKAPAASQPAAQVVSLPRRDALSPEPEPAVSAEDKALGAVKNFYLPQRGVTIGQYFDNIYKDKQADGYEAVWSAEPLHKDIYVVTYRVTKTRQEPAVYIFQADAGQERLLGALNNAALDLVGKLK